MTARACAPAPDPSADGPGASGALLPASYRSGPEQVTRFVKITATAPDRSLEMVAPLESASEALGHLVDAVERGLILDSTPNAFVWEWEPAEDLQLRSASQGSGAHSHTQTEPAK